MSSNFLLSYSFSGKSPTSPAFQQRPRLAGHNCDGKQTAANYASIFSQLLILYNTHPQMHPFFCGCHSFWKRLQLTINGLAVQGELLDARKNIRPKIASPWFWLNRKANKLVSKHKKTYKYKATGEPFFLSKYREERRNHKIKLENIECDYFVNKVCKPLDTGNNKLFYRHNF